MMPPRHDSVQRRFLKYLMTCLILAGSVFTGCDITTLPEDSSGSITIYNYDDYAYWVYLYLVDDDSLMASRYVDTYSASSSSDIDTFTNVDPDQYYLTIVKENATKESGRSRTFHIEENEKLCYQIDKNGDIKDCN